MLAEALRSEKSCNTELEIYLIVCDIFGILTSKNVQITVLTLGGASSEPDSIFDSVSVMVLLADRLVRVVLTVGAQGFFLKSQTALGFLSRRLSRAESRRLK